MRALHVHSRPRQSSNRPCGFSLVEMLAATAIFAVMMTLLLAITSQLNGTWQQADAQKSRRQSARALLDTITRDLEAALLPLNSAATPATNLQFLMNPPETSAEYLNRDAVFWQASLPQSLTESDVAIVGYFVRWKDNQSLLCRIHIPTVRGEISSFPVYQTEKWLTDSLLDEAAPAQANSDYRGLMAENVLAFWVTLYDRTGTKLASSFDSRSGNDLPASAEIALAIVDPATARRIHSASEVRSGYSASTVEDFVSGLPEHIRRGTQIFRTQVNLELSR